MIFIGDVAIGDLDKPLKLVNFPDSFKKETIIANLEGQIVPDESELKSKHCLFNKVSGLTRLLNDVNIKAFALANNHIFDVSNSMKYTIEVLNNLQIKSFGVKSSDIKIDDYLYIKDSYGEAIVLNFGSPSVSCRNVKNNYVNSLTFRNVKKGIISAKEKHPEAKIILYLHWGIELEQIPTPTMRIMAKKYIEYGADLIIGSHPHCVLGYERYMGKSIFYGLGNFLIQENVFLNGKLKYPSLANMEFALEFDNSLNAFEIHTLLNVPEKGELHYINSNKLENHNILQELSVGFSGNYDLYYKINKRKTFLLSTVYEKDNFYVKNTKIALNKLRTIMINSLIKFNILKV
jgi:hypothetical protein